jgi:NADP-dependent 3-hydroxy acid dehydrogenase YdfG
VRTSADFDVGQDEGRKSLEALERDRIDLLICNAGMFVNGNLADLNLDDCQHLFSTNALGVLRTFKALEGKLSAGSKIMVVGSKLGSLGSNKTGGRVRSHFFTSCARVAAVHVHTLRHACARPVVHSMAIRCAIK